MALDKLDLYVIVTLVVAVAAYFAKNQFLANHKTLDFFPMMVLVEVQETYWRR